MPPIKRSSQEEDDFMNDLLNNDSLWATSSPTKPKAKTPSPVATPVRKQRVCEKAKGPAPAPYIFNAEELLEGIDDWDDFDISPRKPSPKKAKAAVRRFDVNSDPLTRHGSAY